MKKALVRRWRSWNVGGNHTNTDLMLDLKGNLIHVGSTESYGFQLSEYVRILIWPAFAKARTQRKVTPVSTAPPPKK